MPASTNLSTLDALKDYLHIADTAEDAILTALIAAASEAIECHTGRVFGSKQFTEYHDGAGRATLVLRHPPVLSVTSVHDDLERAYASATLIPAPDYALDAEAGLVALDAGTFADGRQNVKIVYTAGYASVPKDVALACMILVAAQWARAKRRNDGLRSDSSAGHALDYEDGWPAAVREMLAPYMLANV